MLVSVFIGASWLIRTVAAATFQQFQNRTRVFVFLMMVESRKRGKSFKVLRTTVCISDGSSAVNGRRLKTRQVNTLWGLSKCQAVTVWRNDRHLTTPVGRDIFGPRPVGKKLPLLGVESGFTP